MMRSAVDILICVLHCLGDRRVRNDRKLWRAFHEASEREPLVFGQFKCHPQYGDNPCLSETLTILHMGGSIGYWSSDLHCFSATEAVLGEYGAAKVDELYPQEKEAVQYMAEKIRELR
jgi:hypothetical protein